MYVVPEHAKNDILSLVRTIRITEISVRVCVRVCVCVFNMIAQIIVFPRINS